MSIITIQPIQSIESLTSCAGLLAEVYNAPPWNDNWTIEKALEKLHCFYNSPKFYGCMAFEDSKLVGSCIGNIEPYYTGDYFYLKEMFVSVSSQRKGVGAQLMVALKAQLDTIDIPTIILFTGKHLFPFDFYLKNGFNEMEDMRMMHFGGTA